MAKKKQAESKAIANHEQLIDTMIGCFDFPQVIEILDITRPGHAIEAPYLIQKAKRMLREVLNSPEEEVEHNDVLRVTKTGNWIRLQFVPTEWEENTGPNNN